MVFFIVGFLYHDQIHRKKEVTSMVKTRLYILAYLLSVFTLILTIWAEQAQSQSKYPTRAIQIIVPFGPGGGTDLPTRVAAAYLNKKWGVPLNVVNKPGGKCVPATLELYHAAPDGYTMIADSRAGCSLVGATVKNLPFEIMDRTFIAMFAGTPYILIVPSTSPFKTLEGFIVEAKKNPGSISWTGGDPGIESVVRMFFSSAGLDISKMKLVMITGGAEVVILTAGGHVTLGASVVPSILPAIRGGTVRPLVMMSKARYPDLPDLPTSAELGFPTLTALQWIGISGPPKLPSSIADIWGKTLQEMAKDQGIISQLRNVGALPFYLDAKATREYVTQEIGEARKLLYK
jgi:tripartite-type tricarboxylate transporter receptor subunit TctC